VPARELQREEAAEHGADRIRGEQHAGNPSIVERAEREGRQRREQRGQRDVCDERDGDDRGQQWVGEDLTNAGEGAAPSLGGRHRPADADEGGHDQRRRSIRRAVDVEHLRCAEEWDQPAGNDRSDDAGRLDRDLKRRLRARHLALVLADDLREQRARRGRVRDAEDADRRHEREQRGEGKCADGVEHGNRHEQRCAKRIAEHERPARSERRDDRPSGDAERERRERLAGEDEAHLLRRARRRQDEPRERDGRHVRPEQGDEAGDHHGAEHPDIIGWISFFVK
jgi:hypothetical protein